jgi:TRAP-type C4-dicarboxylate transport system substrate-binding protein
MKIGINQEGIVKMSHKLPGTIVLTLILFILAGPLYAERKITIKMASPVPEKTPWGHYLNRIAAEWKRITNGEVTFIIYHNRTAGKESAVVRNMRVNQLQAGVLSTFGLTEIAPEIMTLSCPFFIRNNEELDLVLEELKGDLEAKVNGKDFFTLAWAKVGWVKIFSKQPVFVPADLKKQKLGTINEYEQLNSVFKSMGFQLVPVTVDELLISLSSPMVDAVYENPIAVGSAQIFALANNMATINMAPFMGAIVMNRRTWNAIPDKYKPQLLEAVRKEESELNALVHQFEEDMIRLMEGYGLKVNQLTPEQEQLWYDEVGRVMPTLVGSVFDKDIYNRIDTLLRNYRNRRP